MPDRRRTFGPVVLLGLAAGTVTAVAGNHPAVSGSGAAAGAMSSLLISFDAHMPLVTALGLVVLACWGVVLVTRGRVRRAVAVLAALASTGALVATLVAWSQVPAQLRDELAQVGVTSSSISHTSWWWAAAVGAVLSMVAAVAAFVLAPAWPEMGARYDAPGAAAEPIAAEPEEQSSLDLWKAMDEGRDPTAADPE
ncbi:Trp biosynthesis-associated membrane protein [Nocardioides sp. URHA0032]|uniref:Trp biosynthesis-associated membrane protein n=1 Tax=Nocardioides sp. URHA0032 TaxID=1380388 RepID=UPI0006878375|nr:Trp biosynthesis-associated membrane protein [Nocardioides sp. URHA0032]